MIPSRPSNDFAKFGMIIGECSGSCERCWQHLSQNSETSPVIRHACYQAIYGDFARDVGDILCKILKHRLISGRISQDRGLNEWVHSETFCEICWPQELEGWIWTPGWRTLILRKMIVLVTSSENRCPSTKHFAKSMSVSKIGCFREMLPANKIFRKIAASLPGTSF